MSLNKYEMRTISLSLIFLMITVITVVKIVQAQPKSAKMQIDKFEVIYDSKVGTPALVSGASEQQILADPAVLEIRWIDVASDGRLLWTEKNKRRLIYAPQAYEPADRADPMRNGYTIGFVGVKTLTNTKL